MLRTNCLLPIPAALHRSVVGTIALLPGIAFGNPLGGQVVGGQATIANPAANGTVVNQSSASAIINWQSFNVAGNEYVRFVQPSSSAVILNRVIGGSPSSIFGSINANGRVFLVNPQGMLFAPGAQVDVGALVASTMDIRNEDFLAGRYVFSGAGAPGAAIVNGGSIRTADGGFAVLAGDYVENTGVIEANLGQIVLASGSALTLDMNSGGLVSYAIDGSAFSAHAGVNNAGQILADGGRVVMTARVGQDLIGTAVNNSGLVRARGIVAHGGTIELTATGGDIADSGTLDAGSTAGNGGNIDIHSDRDIDIQPGAQILADGTTHGGSVTVIADGALSTRPDSLIAARATDSGGQGGFAELSGHQNLTVRGDLELGAGGNVVIDPENLTIADGSGINNPGATNATVYEQFVETQLRNNKSTLTLLATKSVTLDALTDGALDGRNNGNGGSLHIGVGTLQSDGTVAGLGGSVTFQNPANSILIDGDLDMPNGSFTAAGTTHIGNLSARSLFLVAGRDISVGNISTTASNPSLTTPVSAGVVITSSLGSITAGNITTVGTSGGSDVDAHVALLAAAGVHAGAITTSASITRPGGTGGPDGKSPPTATAEVDLIPNGGDFQDPNGGGVELVPALGGDVVVTGTISTHATSAATSAPAKGTDALVAVGNTNGKVNVADIQTSASGPGETSEILLNSSGQDITAGALSVTNAADGITVNSRNPGTGASGDIRIGSIGATGRVPSSITVLSKRSLSFGSAGNAVTSPMAGNIDIEVSEANLAFNTVTATSGSITLANAGGDLSLDTLNSNHSATLQASGKVTLTGTATVGNGGTGGLSISAGTGVTASDIVSNSSIAGSGNKLAITASTGDVVLGNVTTRGGVGAGLSVVAHKGNLTAGNITADSMSLQTGLGNLSAGTLIASSGDITVSGNGGAVNVGDVTANGTTTLAISGAGSTIAYGNVNGKDTSITSDADLALVDTLHTISASQTLSIQSGGALTIGGVNLYGATVKLTAPGDLTLNGTLVHGGNSPPTTDGAIFSGANIHLGSGTTIEGGTSTNIYAAGVSMTAVSGSIDSAASVTIHGNSLSVRAAQNIDLSNAALNIDSGTADFGEDLTMIGALRARAPNLRPSSAGPDASFAAGGTITIGTLDVAGNYVFAQTPSIDNLHFNVPVNAATGGGALLNYLPTNTADTLQIASVSLPAGFSTIAYGGTPQTGNITVDNNIAVSPSSGNVVIDTRRYIVYPSPLSTNGEVVLIGHVVNELPPPRGDVPVLPPNYLPAPGDLGDQHSSGDANDDGVNDANAGRIDVHTVPVAANTCD